MPIHDVSYRHWQGVRAHHPPTIVLGSAQMRVVLQRRAVKGLLLVSGLFVLVYLAILYLETMPREGALGFLHDLPLLRLDARTMQTFLARQRLVTDAGLKGRVRVNSAGCLDQCAHGVTVVINPEAVWYGAVTLEDVDEIVRSHVLEGRPVERLRLPHMRSAE